LGGRPQIETGLRALIRQMSSENPLWGAPCIHGELLKLRFEVAQSSVAKTAFSASSRDFDLNGEARTARTKQSSPIILPA
jgi:hypothetical protein